MDLNAEGINIIAHLSDMYSDDPCWTDHHGYCQAHNLSEDCIFERAFNFMRAYERPPVEQAAAALPAPMQQNIQDIGVLWPNIGFTERLEWLHRIREMPGMERYSIMEIAGLFV